MKLKYIVDKEMPIKEYLEYVGISRHLRKKVRNLDNLYVNGKKEKNYYNLKINDCLELEFNEDINSEYDANFNDLDKLNILYEDEYYIIIDKPNDISSQPSLKHPTYNMLSILKAYFINNNINSNIHLVNRLDYATSGIMIISKSNIGVYELSKTKILKKYLCMTEGIFLEKEGLIDKKIKREEAPSILRYVSDDGQDARTIYKVLKEYDDLSLVEVCLLTGRTHQIRVHMSYIHHPIIGDKLYNDKNNNDILHLHSYNTSFIHPFTKEEINIQSMPKWLK